jgi:hypothetical protein
VSIFDPTAGNVGVVAQLAAMTKLGKARTKFELFGDERTTALVCHATGQLYAVMRTTPI